MTAEITSALNSRFVIDGVPQELTPAQILSSVSGGGEPSAGIPAGTIIDESVDPSISHCELDSSKLGKYLSMLRSPSSDCPPAFSGSYTRGRIASALIAALFRKGSFVLSDLSLKACWEWNPDGVGSLASLYSSIREAADYIDALGLKLESYEVCQADGCRVSFAALVADSVQDGDGAFELPDRVAAPVLKAGKVCPSTLEADPQSWIVYIPFDTSEYRLGGSLLAERLGIGGGTSVKTDDADYFIDCFEVVRELSEDGILLSAAPVGRGGLLKALHSMTGARIGADIDVSEVLRATETENMVKLLFAEVPGVVIQIKDIDFDYIDAELILQDVAFYPLGHPVPGGRGVNVRSSSKSGIQTILDSLLRSRSADEEAF